MIELGVLDSQSRWAVDGLQRVEAQPILTASWRLPDTRTLPRYDPGEGSGSDLHAREASMGTTDNFFLARPDSDLDIAFETRSEGQGELPPLPLRRGWIWQRIRRCGVRRGGAGLAGCDVPR